MHSDGAGVAQGSAETLTLWKEAEGRWVVLTPRAQSTSQSPSKWCMGVSL